MKYKLPQPITVTFFDLPFSGDKSYATNHVASLDAADFTTVIFYSGNDPSFLKNLEAGIVIADSALKDDISEHKAKAIVYFDKPKYIFLSLLEKFFSNTFETGFAMQTNR